MYIKISTKNIYDKFCLLNCSSIVFSNFSIVKRIVKYHLGSVCVLFLEVTYIALPYIQNTQDRETNDNNSNDTSHYTNNES